MAPSDIIDPCSLSNIDIFQITHLDWNIHVDFELQKLSCTAVQSFKCLKDDYDKLVRDKCFGFLKNFWIPVFKI